jgi:hypothetical protein
MPSRVAALRPVARIRLAWAGCRRRLVIVVASFVVPGLGLAIRSVVVARLGAGSVLGGAVMPGFLCLVVTPDGSGVPRVLDGHRGGQVGCVQATGRSGVGGDP